MALPSMKREAIRQGKGVSFSAPTLEANDTPSLFGSSQPLGRPNSHMLLQQPYPKKEPMPRKSVAGLPHQFADSLMLTAVCIPPNPASLRQTSTIAANAPAIVRSRQRAHGEGRGVWEQQASSTGTRRYTSTW